MTLEFECDEQHQALRMTLNESKPIPNGMLLSALFVYKAALATSESTLVAFGEPTFNLTSLVTNWHI